MLKKVEHCYCDKCKKEITNEFIYHEFYQMWSYDLCSECFKEFEEFNNKVEKLKKKWEKLEKEYQYGKYLPED